MTTVRRFTSARITENQVYAGRARAGLSGYWGNPEHLIREANRLLNIARFHHRLFFGDLQHRLANLEQLKDKELLCFCYPQACHCDVYADICNQLWS